MKTREEAEAAVARYNADRCPCGGSPSWVPEHEQVHAVEWHEKNGWPDEDVDEGKAILDAALSDEGARPVACAHCGTPGLRINNHRVINPGPGEVLGMCLVRPPLGREFPLPHGPWEPVI